ncbi:hypothetical protein [Brevundimonas vesicularis]|uniref:hypothetical protein n=1 Tax=Brevundimonas vesicularis TaxID=41276 RepID=UPI00384CD84A
MDRHDALTVGAIAVLAAITVTVSHEAVGHGGTCLAVGGEVVLLTSSLFRCSAGSSLIDLGGPLVNFAIGLIALLTSSKLAMGRPGLRLGLILMAGFAGFWEGGYLVRAMATREGDLYTAGAAFIGSPDASWRILGGVLGVVIYAGAVVLVRRGIGRLGDARRVARISWVAAMFATVCAALVYRGGLGADLRDATLEIGVASAPLLFLNPRGPAEAAPVISRNRLIWLLASGAFIAFTLTMGRGIGAQWVN